MVLPVSLRKDVSAGISKEVAACALAEQLQAMVSINKRGLSHMPSE